MYILIRQNISEINDFHRRKMKHRHLDGQLIENFRTWTGDWSTH